MGKADIIIEKLHLYLEEMAKDIIRQNLDLSIKENQDFLNNPDDVNHQKPEWHQFGIITHTKMVEKAFREELPVYLNRWGIRDITERHLNEEIDGIKKRDLFIMTIILHDTGKFKVRTMKKKNGLIKYSFKPHEKASGEIIRSVKHILKKDFCLTEGQIEYIARCAELHFELGLLRYTGKASKTGFNREFIYSEVFKNTVLEFISKNPDFKWEIGLFFLA
ncbi:MAG: HD domain-containing protein, partial [Candidatus Eremiobacterota bacterium]